MAKKRFPFHSNKDRVLVATEAIRGQYSNSTKRLVKEDIIDILTDIRHLCDARKFDIYEMLGVSYGHYLNERHAEGSRYGKGR